MNSAFFFQRTCGSRLGPLFGNPLEEIKDFGARFAKCCNLAFSLFGKEQAWKLGNYIQLTFSAGL